MLKFTLKDGQTLWVNLPRIICLYGLEDGGSQVVLAAGQDSLTYEVQESPSDFWKNASGQGGVEVPAPGRRIVTS